MLCSITCCVVLLCIRLNYLQYCFVLLPVQVQFSSPHIFCDIAIETVSNTQNGEPVKYGTKSSLTTASYQVV